MFERYKKSARRVIFFARYEASQFGSTTIESEHLLLGVAKENKTTFELLSPTLNFMEAIRREIEVRTPQREKVSTAIDLPLSNECKRILAYTAEETELLRHKHIDSKHLLLGILREENCLAAQLLTKLGFDLKSIREGLARDPELEEGKTDAEGHKQAMIGSSERLRLVLQWKGIPALDAGIAPDSNTAVKIAEAVWHPRFCTTDGDRIAALNADLTHGVWIVTGSHTRNSRQSTVVAFIQKDDGKILRLHQEEPNA